jgi:hypothetical protein
LALFRDTPFRPLWLLALSVPPVWLIVASFLAFANVQLSRGGVWFFIVAYYLLFGAILTFIASVCEWLSEEGHAGPLLLHGAATVVVLIQISRIVS